MLIYSRSFTKGLVTRMGYYDQDYEHLRQKKQKGNRGGWFLSALVGAILGAFLMVFIKDF